MTHILLLVYTLTSLFLPSIVHSANALTVEDKVRNLHVSCETDDDCKRSEVCMSWKYDPALEFARKLRSKISKEADVPQKHQFCIDAWIIYKNHLESLDEPRTGGGLRSRNFDTQEYFFWGSTTSSCAAAVYWVCRGYDVDLVPGLYLGHTCHSSSSSLLPVHPGCKTEHSSSPLPSPSRRSTTSIYN